MFKRKAILPDWPRFPNCQQIQEDLINADDDDIVFCLSPGFLCKETRTEMEENIHFNVRQKDLDLKKETGDDKSEMNGFTDPEKAYEKVRQYLKICKDLEKSLEMVDKEKEQLMNLGNSLAQEVEQVKESLPHRSPASSLSS